MKKLLSALLALCLLAASFTVFAGDANNVEVTLNGQLLTFDVPAQIIGDRTMVPMRKIFETYGFEVEWIASSRTILATSSSGIIVQFTIDSNKMSVTNLLTGTVTKIELDVPPQIVPGDRTLIPIRALSEGIGMHVDWDGDTYTVIITDRKPDAEIPPQPPVELVTEGETSAPEQTEGAPVAEEGAPAAEEGAPVAEENAPSEATPSEGVETPVAPIE